MLVTFCAGTWNWSKGRKLVCYCDKLGDSPALVLLVENMCQQAVGRAEFRETMQMSSVTSGGKACCGLGGRCGSGSPCCTSHPQRGLQSGEGQRMFFAGSSFELHAQISLPQPPQCLYVLIFQTVWSLARVSKVYEAMPQALKSLLQAYLYLKAAWPTGQWQA